jgi:diguanylate cyclase (GGDEF)-like protein
MALPKILIKTLPPSLFLLSAGLLYSAFQQVQLTEHQAQVESKRNLQIAEQIVDSQLNAAVSKIFQLEQAQQTQSLGEIAQSILDKHVAYSDIMSVDSSRGDYFSFTDQKRYALPKTELTWRPINDLAKQFWFSSIYKNHQDRWVFALKHQKVHSSEELWIQFDLQITSSRLEALKTLSNGYLFIVEQQSGLIVIHPDLQRIGTPSVSYQSGIAQRVAEGERSGEHEYYYKTQFKVSQFDLDEDTGWVYVSGTDRKEILAASHQFAIAGLILLVIIFSAVIRNYLLNQLNSALKALAQQEDLNQFKQALKAIFDRFFYHRGLTFCVYDAHHHQFQTLDYHGNLQNVVEDPNLAKVLVERPVRFLTQKSADKVAKTLKIRHKHYSIPLKTNEGLLGVVYLQTALPVPYALLCAIQTYSEVALANLMLSQRLKSKDVMTQLDNKLTIREKINEHLTLPHTYFAMLDIDHFKQINDNYGHQCGDKVIIQAALLMEKCFPKPGAISIARYGGEEFCILFSANNENDAYDQCELLRQRIENSPLIFNQQQVRYTVSIGITQIRDSQHITIGRADKALYQAKGLGRNQVVLNTFE